MYHPPKSIVELANCMDAMKQYPDKHFDLAVVDPPYGINATNMQMGTHKTKKKGMGISTAVKLKGRLNSGGEKLKNRILNTEVLDWDNEVPPPEYFTELFRVSKQQIIWGGNYFNLPATRCIICWDKKQPWDNFSQWEMAWTSFDKPAKMYRISTTGGSNAEKKIHPTQKPVELYKKVFQDFATEGMKILDTHVGSGSSRIAAYEANLQYTGYEICEPHYHSQQKRYKRYTSQLKFF